MVIYRPGADIRSTQRLERSTELPYLDGMTNELQKALDELTTRYPDLETAHDYQEYLRKLSHEIERKSRFLDRPGMEESENTPRGVFRQDAEHLNWLAESTRKVEQGQKYVRDCYRFVHLSKNPSSKSRNPAAATTTEVLGQGLPLPQQNSQISLVCSLSRVRERLELLESTTTAPAFRCFVSLYKRDKMDEAHLDDHLLIANAGSRASQQKADSMQDAKQFCAVYGQCPETPVALKYTDVFCHLYGLTPEEARGSLREGPVTDIINEHANYLMQSDQIDAGVTAAFSRFISEVRKWSYLPGIGRIIVPEYHIDEDLERLYCVLRQELDAATTTT